MTSARILLVEDDVLLRDVLEAYFSELGHACTALGTYEVPRAGPVLLFAAEDRPPAIRKRLEGLAERYRDIVREAGLEPANFTFEVIEQDLSVDEIAARGFERETVIRVLEMVRRNEYKRRQAPPGIRISSRAFGRDWRYPITSGYRFPG